jgi:sugar-specific transcriptional regulator TrmB
MQDLLSKQTKDGTSVTVMLKTERNIKTLNQLGLTVNQARAYLALVKLRSANAKEISKASNIAQQDIYRVMPLLQKIGLVEKLVASPNRFKPNSPEHALSVLLRHREKENSILHEESTKLIEELSQSTANTDDQQDVAQFSIISGKKTILMKSRKAITEASESICVLTPWKHSAKNTQHFLAISKRALSRQVKIRFILYLPEKEADVFLKMMPHLREDSRFRVKFIFNEKPAIFSVFDRGQVFFPTQKGSLGDAPILWSTNPNFAALTQDYFDMLWETAQESPRNIDEKSDSNSFNS